MELGRSEERVFNLPQFPQWSVLDKDKSLSDKTILERMKRKRTREYAARQALNPHLSHPPSFPPFRPSSLPPQTARGGPHASNGHGGSHGRGGQWMLCWGRPDIYQHG